MQPLLGISCSRVVPVETAEFPELYVAACVSLGPATTHTNQTQLTFWQASNSHLRKLCHAQKFAAHNGVVGEGGEDREL